VRRWADVGIPASEVDERLTVLRCGSAHAR
jgi:hypothetical protein